MSFISYDRIANASKSHYTYSVTRFCNRPVLAIEDLDNGGMSVTNNIENVIPAIVLKANNIDPEYVRGGINADFSFLDKYIIVYRDSMGMWDGWDTKQNTFVHLGEKDQTRAMIGYLNKVNRPRL